MTPFNFVPQPPDLPSQVPAMVWHWDSQKADHYSGVEVKQWKDDSGGRNSDGGGSGYGAVDAKGGIM